MSKTFYTIYMHLQGRLTNNLIFAGKGGVGGNGTRYGGNGGDSIAIYSEDSIPIILDSYIATKGLGHGGTGLWGWGGDGGDSCGIYISGSSGSTISGNTFQIGPAGQGNEGEITTGNDGVSCDTCPPPAFQSYNVVQSQSTVSSSINIKTAIKKAIFTTSWSGSDVVMTLISPSGKIIDRNTTDPDVKHILA